jgi:hypothetical protein
VRSSDSAERLALDRDLPTTAADVAALRRARRGARIELEAYLRFLGHLAAPAAGVLRARRGPTGPAFSLQRRASVGSEHPRIGDRCNFGRAAP